IFPLRQSASCFHVFNINSFFNTDGYTIKRIVIQIYTGYLVIKKSCFLQCFRKAIFYDCIKLFVNLLDMLNKYSYTFFYRNITVFNTSSYGYGIHGKELLIIYGTINDRIRPQLIICFYLVYDMIDVENRVEVFLCIL